MIRIDVAEAEAIFDEILDKVEQGEVLCCCEMASR
jgi:hypothetical protein